jgi:hypothetical protein
MAPLRADNDKKVGLAVSIDEETENVGGEFCTLDATGKKLKKRTVGEMEQVGGGDSLRSGMKLSSQFWVCWWPYSATCSPHSVSWHSALL